MLNSIKKRLSIRSKSASPIPNVSGPSTPDTGAGTSPSSTGNTGKASKKKKTHTNLRDFKKSLSMSMASSLDQTHDEFGNGNHSSLPTTPTLKKYVKKFSEDSSYWDGMNGRSRELETEYLRNGFSDASIDSVSNESSLVPEMNGESTRTITSPSSSVSALEKAQSHVKSGGSGAAAGTAESMSHANGQPDYNDSVSLSPYDRSSSKDVDKYSDTSQTCTIVDDSALERHKIQIPESESYQTRALPTDNSSSSHLEDSRLCISHTLKSVALIGNGQQLNSNSQNCNNATEGSDSHKSLKCHDPIRNCVTVTQDISLVLSSNSNSIFDSGTCLNNNTTTEAINSPGIKPEFNEWQFWNDSTYCDSLIDSELGLGKEKEEHEQKHGHGQDQDRVLTDYNGNDYVNVNEKSSLDQEQDDKLSSSLYYLTPCAECFNANVNANATVRQTNPIRLITAGNSSSSCEHSRELIQIVDILFPADSDSGSRMGNQSGKESKIGSAGKGSKNILKRGDAKNGHETTTTIQATSNETSNVIIGPNTIVVQKPSKKLAPPPPPPALHVQQSASRNNEKGTTINVQQENENNVNANHNEREPSLDFDPSSGSSDLLADSYLTAANGFSATGSYYSALGNLTTSQQEDVGDDDTLMNQSDQLSIDSVELIMPSITESNGNLNNLDDEGQVFQTSAPAAGLEMNNSGPQRPMTTSFTLTRKRKVELSAVSSPVDEIPPAGPIGGRKDTTVSEQCLVGGDDSSYSQSSPIKTYGRYNSVSDVPYQESNVLRKVASLVLAEQQTAGLKQSVSKPKFVPEKLDFKIYEKFEGQMLINWFISSFNDGHYLKDTLTMQDLKYLATQYCTLLLAAGVLKQIEEVENTPLDSIFRPDLMYYWSHSESPAISTQVPGKLPPVSWPPSNDISSSAPRNGAKYTEADCGSRTLSPEHLPEPGTVPKTVSHFESECDLTRVVSATTSPTADVNGPEFQQMMMGLKREHKEILEKKVAQHEVDVFAVRGETVELLQKKYASRIEELEKEVETLRTLLSIQNLTNKVEADFASPTDAAAPPPPPLMAGMPPPPPPPPPMSGMPPPPPPPMGGMPPPPPPMAGMPPPPPPMGGPPPPPSMPSLSAGPPPPPMKIELRKKPVTPKVPMKPLYWTRIQITTPATHLVTESENPKFSVEREDKENKVEPKLWEKIDEVSVGNWDDFTQLFAKQVTEKKETPDNSQSEDEVKKASKKPRQQTVSLLDQKRAQNLLIFVKSNKLEDISKIKSIIYNLELGDLKLETLEKVLACKASDEEYALIKDQVDSNSDVALDPADRYLYDLHSIPKFADRITCFIFQFTFYESLSSIETKLNNFQLVCEKLVSSKDLQKVLALILTYGNYMNGGNMVRGQADGFSLEILPQLRDVKSKENSYTFLHFIVATYVQMYDEFKGTTEAKLPTPEPSDIESAASIDFDAIQKDLNILKKDLEDCEKRTHIVINSSTDENLEPFKTKMTEFLDQAKGKVQNIEETYEEGQRMYLTTMKFFDFNPNKKVAGKAIVCPPADFFTNWLRFCNDFKEIWKGEQQKILKEKIRESERFIQQKQSAFSKYFTKAPKKKGGLKDKLAQKMAK